jgi:CubicO group peptidase (beta-lactamase class C family)
MELVGSLKSKRWNIEEICRLSGVAGVTVTVIHHGETIFQDCLGYRNVAAKDPVTPDTICHIASLTKSFTGACIYQLQALGKLSIDDLITKHLPFAKSLDLVVASTATIADLLGHRTGLQKADNIWLGSDGQLLLTKDQTSAIFSHLQPQASLRSGFLYNNIGYAVLGEIISKVSGKPYHTYLEDNILAPLNMSRTLDTKDDDLPDNVSLAYSTLQSGEPYNIPLPGMSDLLPDCVDKTTRFLGQYAGH